MLVQVSDLLSKYRAIGSGVAEFLVVTVILYVVGRFVLLPVSNWILATYEFDPTLEAGLQKVLSVGVGVVAVVLGAAAAGFGAAIGGSALIVAALTLAVGFAAQDVISNFVSGVFIVGDPNFNIGDWIEWDDKAGIIDDIGFRSTRVRTFDNETITVPNTLLSTEAVTNRMSQAQLRVSCVFGIGYGDDIDEASRLLLSVADDHPEVLADPPPSVRVVNLGDAAIELQARFWIEDPSREEFSVARSEYIQQVAERFRDRGIDLSTTTQHALTGELAVSEREPGASSP